MNRSADALAGDGNVTNTKYITGYDNGAHAGEPWQDPQQQAQAFEAFVYNAWVNYCAHGSACPMVKALAAKYPACDAFVATHRWVGLILGQPLRAVNRCITVSSVIRGHGRRCRTESLGLAGL